MDNVLLQALAATPSLMTNSLAGPIWGAAASTGDAVFPAANRVLYTPFVVRHPIRAIRVDRDVFEAMVANLERI